MQQVFVTILHHVKWQLCSIKRKRVLSVAGKLRTRAPRDSWLKSQIQPLQPPLKAANTWGSPSMIHTAGRCMDRPLASLIDLQPPSRLKVGLFYIAGADMRS